MQDTPDSLGDQEQLPSLGDYEIIPPERLDSVFPGAHTQKEDDPWAINIPDHAPRTDSPAYRHARALLQKITTDSPPPLYGSGPYQDHHGGGLWLKDADGWFMVRNLAGIEWSAQFAGDPQKVDQLRQNARRLYAGFPGVAEELGIRDLLDTPITDAAGIALWTDSICNASVPLRPDEHTGTLPRAGGMHHYPAPIVDIEFIKRDDFALWVLDQQGKPAAVAPVAPSGTGDRRVQVLYSTPGTVLNQAHEQALAQGGALLLAPRHPIARMAFARQTTRAGDES